jgi:lipopolysaccharide/colanic/teichoic acid biosynthesis glycosyltransferase
LRKTSLDELPELVNVIKGDMSLVGPRPLLVEYLPNYSPLHRRRHLVRPGITGLAQISGRRSLTFRQRLDLDIQYIEAWSPLLDLRILLKTLFVPFTTGSDESQSLDSVDDVGLMRKR